ncbi:tryptophan synthase beta subunit-like PLP-dependent enzyme, partial [Caulochytrium protostelioides]
MDIPPSQMLNPEYREAVARPPEGLVVEGTPSGSPASDRSGAEHTSWAATSEEAAEKASDLSRPHSEALAGPTTLELENEGPTARRPMASTAPAFPSAGGSAAGSVQATPDRPQTFFSVLDSGAAAHQMPKETLLVNPHRIVPAAPLPGADPYPTSVATNATDEAPTEADQMQYNPAHAYSARTRQTIEPDYLKLILMARVYDVAKESPLSAARLLSARLRNTILIKREDLQSVFSFKCRGAYNRMQHLAPSERAKGVVACSAGNHAQGVALSAREMGMRATIVMPVATPPIKYMNVERLGATVVLHGADFDEAKAECARLSTEQGLVNIPPFDDPYVIAGQGTIGVEILRQTE